MKWIVFIILKVLEVSAIVFVPWGIGLVAQSISPSFFNTHWVWLDGVAVMLMGGVLAILCFWLFIFVESNIEWAEKIYKKIKQQRD